MRGTGAVELQARFARFVVSNDIFTQGIADPRLWTNDVSVVDAGVNWYWNRYLKWYVDWQHSVFANPVPYRPGKFQNTSDLFWIRCQLYF
jgi:phosphate-selective porin OprO/OprP